MPFAKVTKNSIGTQNSEKLQITYNLKPTNSDVMKLLDLLHNGVKEYFSH